MRAALALVFGFIFLTGIYLAHRRGVVPFDRHVGGARRKEEAPGWYRAMMVLYGTCGVALVSWGIWALLVPSRA